MDLKIEYLDREETLVNISKEKLIEWLKENFHYPVKHSSPPGPEDGTLLKNRPYSRFIPKETGWIRITLVEK